MLLCVELKLRGEVRIRSLHVSLLKFQPVHLQKVSDIVVLSGIIVYTINTGKDRGGINCIGMPLICVLTE